MAKSKIVQANEKIAEGVTTGFKKMSDGVVEGFNKMSDGVVKGYTKIEDKFVSEFLTKDGETVEEAKERLKSEQKEREEKSGRMFRAEHSAGSATPGNNGQSLNMNCSP